MKSFQQRSTLVQNIDPPAVRLEVINVSMLTKVLGVCSAKAGFQQDATSSTAHFTLLTNRWSLTFEETASILWLPVEINMSVEVQVTRTTVNFAPQTCSLANTAGRLHIW
jgi:hypothetical protein